MVYVVVAALYANCRVELRMERVMVISVKLDGYE